MAGPCRGPPRLPGRAARPSAARVVVTAVLLGPVLTGAVALTGVRPATFAFAWAVGAAVVLASVDLLVHRLPDRVTFPAFAVCTAAFVVDAVVLDAWGPLLRSLAAAAVALAVAAAAAAVSREGLASATPSSSGSSGSCWAGRLGRPPRRVFLGLVAGAVVSLVLPPRGGPAGGRRSRSGRRCSRARCWHWPWRARHPSVERVLGGV